MSKVQLLKIILVARNIVSIIGDDNLVIEDITPIGSVGAIISVNGSNGLVTEPLVPMAQLPVLVVCLKNITYRTKHLKNI